MKSATISLRIIHPPSEAKAGILRLRFKSSVEPPSGGLLRARNFTAQGNRARHITNSARPLRLPCAVKFLESLEPSPKEGSKRGLGQRPKVLNLSPSYTECPIKRGMGLVARWINTKKTENLVFPLTSGGVCGKIIAVNKRLIDFGGADGRRERKSFGAAAACRSRFFAVLEPAPRGQAFL